MIHLYGIANCDTVRKARKWLVNHGIDHVFHDFKKEGVDVALLQQWCDACGWEVLLNKRGATWRKLDESKKSDIYREKALALMCTYPSMIKRPVVMAGESIEVGFSEARYSELFT